jgi:hypothetical protein
VFARAKDAAGVYSAAASASVVVNALPTIGSLSASPGTLTQGASVTLSATSVADADGGVTQVLFYRDANANGLLDAGIDVLLGSGISTTPGTWTLTLSSGSFPVGAIKYLALAQDDRGAWSTPKTASGTINAPLVPAAATPASSPTLLDLLLNSAADTKDTRFTLTLLDEAGELPEDAIRVQ